MSSPGGPRQGTPRSAAGACQPWSRAAHAASLVITLGLLVFVTPTAVAQQPPPDAAPPATVSDADAPPAHPSTVPAGNQPVDPAGAPPPDENASWIPLFNGRDLEGWTPKIRGYDLGENYGNTFRVEDGLLKVRYDQYDRFDEHYGHLFYAQPYSAYRLRVEYRFVGDQAPGGQGWAFRNSGIMIHGQTPASMGRDQRFPVSIEVQLLGGAGTGQRSTANLCTPGTHVVRQGKLHTPHCTNSSSQTYHGDTWVQVEIEVLGHQRVRHFVEGQLVLEYTEPQLDPRDADAAPLLAGEDRRISGGTISLQSESHPIDFRKVELRPLPPPAERP